MGLEHLRRWMKVGSGEDDYFVLFGYQGPGTAIVVSASIFFGLPPPVALSAAFAFGVFMGYYS